MRPSLNIASDPMSVKGTPVLKIRTLVILSCCDAGFNLCCSIDSWGWLNSAIALGINLTLFQSLRSLLGCGSQILPLRHLMGVQLAREKGIHHASTDVRVFFLNFVQRIHNLGRADYLDKGKWYAIRFGKTHPAGNQNILQDTN